MVNGKPRDSELTDIVVYKLPVFSPEADELIRQIVRLGGERELERRFNLSARPPSVAFTAELKKMRDQLREEAKARGWEIDE